MSEEQIKDMILKQCLELTTNNDFRPPISAYDGVDIDDVVRTCKQLQDKKTYLDLIKENKKIKDKLSKIETLIINHNCDTGDIYYKYNSKFLKSELKQRILEILEDKEV